MDSENVHESNMNINIRKKIFEYSNIFEYSFQHWVGYYDRDNDDVAYNCTIGDHGNIYLHKKLDESESQNQNQDQHH